MEDEIVVKVNKHLAKGVKDQADVIYLFVETSARSATTQYSRSTATGLCTRFSMSPRLGSAKFAMRWKLRSTTLRRLRTSSGSILTLLGRLV